jgi:hypothetical protein
MEDMGNSAKTYITVGIRARALAGSFTLVRKRFPAWVHGANHLLEPFSIMFMPVLAVHFLRSYYCRQPSILPLSQLRNHKDTHEQRSMQFQHPPPPLFFIPNMLDCSVMQAINVLRDQLAEHAAVVKCGESVVGWVRLGVTDGRVAKVRAKPVSLPERVSLR